MYDDRFYEDEQLTQSVGKFMVHENQTFELIDFFQLSFQLPAQRLRGCTPLADLARRIQLHTQSADLVFLYVGLRYCRFQPLSFEAF